MNTKLFFVLVVLGILCTCGSGVVAFQPEEAFQTTNYVGIHINDPADIGPGKVTLSGNVDDPGIDDEAWFIIGTKTGSYSYYTSAVTPEADGSFELTVEGQPLFTGKDYYVAGCCQNGRTASEKSFTTNTSTAVPTTTYGRYWDDIQASNKSPPVLLDKILEPGRDVFGGGKMGETVLAGFILGSIFIFIWLRHEDVAIPVQVGFIAGGFLMSFIAPEFVNIAYVLVILSVFGIGYSIIRKSW